MKYAVIIKHPGRDFDWRVDIVDVDDNVDPQDIRKVIERSMLGPFEVISITAKVSDRNISAGLERLARESESHIET